MNSLPNAQLRRAVFSSSVVVEANLVPSCEHLLLKEGSALYMFDPTSFPLSSVILKQDDAIVASQVYPAGHLGDRAMQKYGLPPPHIPVLHLKLCIYIVWYCYAIKI